MNSDKLDKNSPAVRRIIKELRELQKDEESDVLVEPLEDNVFEWHFVIRGPAKTEFEGGLYHGRIVLPAEYPFKPPSFIFLTPNGRFETNKKICLSISQHHADLWQPSWSMRVALLAIIAYMPTPGKGTLGSLDFPQQDRIELARKSHKDIPQTGDALRQTIINGLHQQMLNKIQIADQKQIKDTQQTTKEAQKIQEGQQQNDQIGTSKTVINSNATNQGENLNETQQTNIFVGDGQIVDVTNMNNQMSQQYIIQIQQQLNQLYLILVVVVIVLLALVVHKYCGIFQQLGNIVEYST